MINRLPYVWDYDISEEQFTQLLTGELTLGRLNREWAVLRLLEYAPYREIMRDLASAHWSKVGRVGVTAFSQKVASGALIS